MVKTKIVHNKQP